MLKKLAIAVGGLAAVVAVIFALALMQPDTFTVTRTITIKAPPEKIIGLVTDFNQWKSWSPWEKLDPAMQRTITGAPNGKGSIYEWKGNSDVGAGRMEVLDVQPAAVQIKLDFLDPFESHNQTEFKFDKAGESTTVTWTMTGPMLFASKVMSVFTSMDSMIGKDFEKGLASMKQVAEK
ncbi:MAG: SRPBCC family protein [Pseudomonadota bacterium]